MVGPLGDVDILYPYINLRFHIAQRLRNLTLGAVCNLLAKNLQ